jgi:hypothetical protein
VKNCPGNDNAQRNLRSIEDSSRETHFTANLSNVDGAQQRDHCSDLTGIKERHCEKKRHIECESKIADCYWEEIDHKNEADPEQQRWPARLDRRDERVASADEEDGQYRHDADSQEVRA